MARLFTLTFPSSHALLEEVSLLFQCTHPMKKVRGQVPPLREKVFLDWQFGCYTLISNSTVAQSLCPHTDKIKSTLKYLLAAGRTV